jgi:hypothetical protein
MRGWLNIFAVASRFSPRMFRVLNILSSLPFSLVKNT